ncbi:MAG TPA: S8 family serine peptidase, partial [Vicinamibacterales bacterium]|nr:S8 family serine peptidase [Vicinamibacterales bacterium]
MIPAPEMPATRARRPWYFLAAAAVALLALAAPHAEAQGRAKLSRDLEARLAAGAGSGTTDIIIDRLLPGAIERLAAKHGARIKRHFSRGAVLEVDAESLRALAADPDVPHLSGNHVIGSTMAVAVQATGADQLHGASKDEGARFTGRGIGVAVIDSGIARHSSLAGKVVASLDFIEGGRAGRGAGDEYGHGTHVASIIAGREEGSGGLRGMAPGAHLVNLRVLDENGRGTVADVIDAIDWAVANRARYQLHVINLSLGAAPQENSADDPLVQAVDRAVQAGMLVVASAGNFGKTDDGRMIIGGIVSPGLAPSALTVGGANTRGTAFLGDDTVATWSSRGPTYPDGMIKPDVIAPANRIVAAGVSGSTLWNGYPERQASGRGDNGRFEMSGTSMSAAVVSGAAALLLEAAPSLTPAQIKIALQLTASPIEGAGLIEMGAGEINLPLALFVAQNGPNVPLPSAQIAGVNVVPSGITFGSAD